MIGSRLSLAFLVVMLIGAAPKPADNARDPINPSCPKLLNWSTAPTMKFSIKTVDGTKIVMGEGGIDNSLLPRLAAILKSDPDITELWLRSPGGSAVVGNEAGRLIRKNYPDLITRIPKGWACFSACNFLFMGGKMRIVEPEGQFVVHMFTHVADRAAVRADIKDDADAAVDMIGDIEQSSALLASDDNDFLIRMGVSRKLLTEVMYQQKAVSDGGKGSTRRCLTQDEVYKYNVANAR